MKGGGGGLNGGSVGKAHVAVARAGWEHWGLHKAAHLRALSENLLKNEVKPAGLGRILTQIHAMAGCH
jgi:hypothetical protein